MSDDQDKKQRKEGVATEDDLPSVTNLRNLFRNGKINKSQYVGSLATMLAAGLISKSQFTRLREA